MVPGLMVGLLLYLTFEEIPKFHMLLLLVYHLSLLWCCIFLRFVCVCFWERIL